MRRRDDHFGRNRVLRPEVGFDFGARSQPKKRFSGFETKGGHEIYEVLRTKCQQMIANLEPIGAQKHFGEDGSQEWQRVVVVRDGKRAEVFRQLRGLAADERVDERQEFCEFNGFIDEEVVVNKSGAEDEHKRALSSQQFCERKAKERQICGQTVVQEFRPPMEELRQKFDQRVADRRVHEMAVFERFSHFRPKSG